MNSSTFFAWYLRLAPAELFRLLQRQMGVAVRNGIYSARLVIWMMIAEPVQPSPREELQGAIARRGNTCPNSR